MEVQIFLIIPKLGQNRAQWQRASELRQSGKREKGTRW
jgi:hypothetical protein